MKGKIFNAQEVQAILNGSKVMFREVIKNISPRITIQKGKNNQHFAVGDDWAKCPYQIGQKIFCKEKFAEVGAGFGYKKQILYRADADYVVDWSPAQHMKQEHSRLTLQIKSIGVERLGDISEEDAVKEGNYLGRCECLPRKKDKSPMDVCFSQHFCHIHGEEFKHAWNATHKKPEEKWEANPFVFCFSYEVVR